MNKITKIVRRTVLCAAALTLALGVAGADIGCESHQHHDAALSGKITPGSCCDKAAKEGKACTMDCCVTAAKDGKICTKCNPPG